MAESTENDQTLEHGQPLQQDDSKEPVAEQAPDFDVDRPDEEEDDFGEEEEDDDDDFGDFGDADDAGDFGDFETSDDFPTDEFPMAQEKKQPTDAEEYLQVLETALADAPDYVERFLQKLWGDQDISIPSSPVSHPTEESTKKILCTQCSQDLWEKLSRDSVFYNSVTGAIGQFQWTRSETNRAYLNALGVTINYDDKSGSSAKSGVGLSKRPQSNYLDTKSSSNMASCSSAPVENNRTSPHRTKSASLSGVNINGNHHQTVSEKAVEQEPELDIDIARAYCELTEETIRVFPDEKLKAMVTELTRLQRQATEYLGYLLDQREQLMMDAETYNDLISCIVGHAQRLREQNVGKDASPAMVSRKKKNGGGLSMLRRKQNSGTQSASMGGGVVGVKQAGSQKKTTGEGRRSM